MKLWFLVRGYPKDFIEAEMKKVKFTSKAMNTKERQINESASFCYDLSP